MERDQRRYDEHKERGKKVAKGSGNNWISFGEPHWSLAFECICIVVLWPAKRLCSLHPKAKYMSHAFMLRVFLSSYLHNNLIR